MRTALFINTHSRNARKHVDHVKADFKKAKKFQIIETFIIEDLGELDQKLDDLKHLRDLECVIVGSGDGTIVSVLNALQGKDITYGFLPLGTSNTFVRSLGLPLSYKEAKDVILKQHPKSASLGTVNGKLFANIAGIGVPAEVTRSVTNKIKRLLGPLAYIVTGMRTTLQHNAFYCHIESEDVSEGFYTHYLLLANGKYHGPLPLGKDVSAYNDKLMLIAVGVSESRWKYASAAISLIFRRHEKDSSVRMIPFSRAEISTRPSRSIEADGEIISRTPATVEIIKDAIRVFTEPPASPKRRHRRTLRRRS